jgi:hypothetical protein
MKGTLFAIVALAISLVSAEIKITKPVASTKWSFGKTETVEWTAGPTDTGAKDLYVFFLNGSDPKTFKGESYVAKVAVPDVAAGSAKVDLSTVDLTKYPKSSNQYFIRIGDVSGGYSSQFTITGGSGADVPAAAASGATGATGAAAPGAGAAGATAAKPGVAATGLAGAAATGAPGAAATGLAGASKATITRTVTATAAPTGKATSDATANAAISLMAIFAAFIALFL